MFEEFQHCGIDLYVCQMDPTCLFSLYTRDLLCGHVMSSVMLTITVFSSSVVMLIWLEKVHYPNGEEITFR